MIHKDLHRQPQALDRRRHAALKLRADAPTLAAAAGLASIFLTSAEFGDACREYPIVFLPAGNDAEGRAQAAPVVACGLAPGENLLFDDGRWRASYVPAVLRAYPFTMGRTDEQQTALCIDAAFDGFAEDEGEPLIGADGEPTPFLRERHAFVEAIETEVERTRLFCAMLMEAKLLAPRRFDATLPDGRHWRADGFMTIDDEALAGLPDAEVLRLHRNGVLELIHAHRISLANMQRLVDLKRARGSA